MGRKRFKNKENKSSGSASWMTTFSDLMSLLLTFFILLYSMSTIDLEKFKSISYSLQSILTGLGEPTIIEGQDSKEPIFFYEDNDDDDSSNITMKEEILVMYDKVQDYIANEELDAKVSVSMNKRGVFVDIKEAILFPSGSAEIKESGLRVLKQLEGLINDFNNDIVIEGHTDDVPIRSILYPSNWELSTARAVSVVRYLSEVEKVNPKRLSAIGYGEYRPIVPNDNNENRGINRRVNILIIFDEESDDVNDSRDNQ